MAEKTWINIGGVNKEAIPWINVNGTWKQCIPWVNVNGVWKKCYDTGTTVYTNLYYIPASGDSASQSQKQGYPDT